MLGRLFGNAASSLSSVSYPRDSIVDEEYTRGLLFPEHAASQNGPIHVPQVRAARTGDFDDWSGLELDASKDLRIMIAQDALGDSEEPCILFDSNPIQRPTSPTDLAQCTGSLHNFTHRRGDSTTSILRSPPSPLFSKPQQRLLSNGPNMSFPMRNRSSTFSGASDEHDPRRVRSSDLKEETRTILNCAFGSSAGASFGTKMHVLSLGFATKELPMTPSSPGVGGNTSASYFRKREPIARAYTSALPVVKPPVHERSHSISGGKPKFIDAVLITKLFSVNLPEPTDLQTSESTTAAQDGGPSSNSAEAILHNPPMKGKKPRAKKTPVFAIILVVQLPTNLSTFPHPLPRGFVQSPLTCNPGRFVRNSLNSYSTSPKLASIAPLPDPGDARVNALVDHWDIIDRALTLLENVSAPRILNCLKRVDSFSAALVSKSSKPKEKTMQRTNQINIYLNPLTLDSDAKLRDIARQAVQRIRRALRIPRVMVGQRRWGLWNDELIRIARWSCGKEQKLFIINLLTSFLGTHTAEWMTLLATSWHRRRDSITRKANEADVITTRTVIVSDDRSIARRLVFLLSSFLAGDVHSESGRALHRGPGSSISLRNDAILPCPSPEDFMNTQRDQSPERHQSRSSDHGQGGLPISGGLERKPSDIQSVRSIPIPASDLSFRKSSAATTSTITPNSTTPVPQFSSSSGPGGGYFLDESSASASLTKIWKTANRDSESSTASTKWGSLLSGFWGKESSGTISQTTAPSIPSSIKFSKLSQLDTMVKELGSDESAAIPALANDPSQSVASPLSPALPPRLHVNADDGVIDVDIGIPGFISSSNDSGLASSSFRNVPHVSSVTSLDSLASPKHHLSPKRGSRAQSRVAGYLPRFHPDYSLQAVRVSKSDLPDMIEEIKGAMLSEPYSQESTTPGWVDVSTTLIANVQTASVKRLRLKRKVSRVGDYVGGGNRAVTPSIENATTPRRIKPCSTTSGEFVQEQAFSYDSVIDFDPLLTDVVERILARDGANGSRSISPAPVSHSRQVSTGTNESPRRSHKQSTFSGSPSPEGLSRDLSDNLVIGALEDVVKTVNHELTEAPKRQMSDAHLSEQSAAQMEKSQDNALRDGVRSWLLNMEHPAVW